MQEKVRNSNIELLRIISMLMIVAYHSATNVLSAELWKTGSNLNKVTVAFLYPAGRCGVMLFFMITGYFLCNKRSRNCTKMIVKTVFYSCISAIVYFIARLILKKEIQVYGGGYTPYRYLLTPISSGLIWFVTCYLMIIMVMPILNGFLGKLSKNIFFCLLIFLNLNLYGFGTLLNSPYAYLYEALFFYACGVFYKRFVNFKKQNVSLFMAFISYILAASCSYLLYKGWSSGFKLSFIFLFCVRNVFVPAFCFFFFTLFLSLSLEKRNIINQLASASLAVYLLHGSVFQKLMWDKVFKITELYQRPYYPAVVPVIAILVYSACFLIDTFCERLIFQKLYKHADTIRCRLTQAFKAAEKHEL